MFAPHLVVAQACGLRLIALQLAKRGDALTELGKGQVAAELLHLELKIMELHDELLETADSPVSRPYKPEPAQEELPF
jgi:hypothetical protein